jgi:hydrogenase maturation protease
MPIFEDEMILESARTCSKMQKSLILGYGNLDRQDDGVAWFVLSGIAKYLGFEDPPDDEGFIYRADGIDLDFELQLTPEIAEFLSGYDRVCFVDAHTGAKPVDIDAVEIEAIYQTSPFTHHMTPQTLLSFAAALYQAKPRGFLVSVRGYEFGFKQGLSPATARLVDLAVTKILEWLEI